MYVGGIRNKSRRRQLHPLVYRADYFPDGVEIVGELTAK
jgi:hypothetical protein